MKYDDIRPSLQTGDLLLYSGGGNFSAWIKAMTFCKWSHVAVVVRMPEPGAVLAWESSTDGVALVDLDQQMKPEKLQFIKRVINYSAGEVAVRHLECDFRDGFTTAFDKFRREVEGRPYETNNMELTKAVLGVWGNNKEALASIFCSELVAETYKRWGLLPDSRPSNTYRPKDFAGSASLPLLGGASLGPEILLIEGD